MWSLYDSSTACSCFSKPLSSTVTMEMNWKALKTYFENSPNNFQQVLQCQKNYCCYVTVAHITPQWFYSPCTQLAWPQRADRSRREVTRANCLLIWVSGVTPPEGFHLQSHSILFFSVPELNTAVHLTPVILNAVLIRSKHIKRGGIAPM